MGPKECALAAGKGLMLRVSGCVVLVFSICFGCMLTYGVVSTGFVLFADTCFALDECHAAHINHRLSS